MGGCPNMCGAAPVKPIAASRATRATRASASRRSMQPSRSTQHASGSGIAHLPPWMETSPSGSGSALTRTTTSFSERCEPSRRTTACSRRLSAAADTDRSAVPNNGRGLRRRAAGRVGKRFFRTPAGALLLEHAGRAFAELEAAQKEALRQLRGVWRGGCASAPAAPPASTAAPAGDGAWASCAAATNPRPWRSACSWPR